MAIYCCSRCGAWHSCTTKWVRTEKGEDNLCCSVCGSYNECIRKDIDSILEERASKLDWLRKELDSAVNPKAEEQEYVQGLSQRDFKAFIANYALTGFWVVYGLETKFLEQNVFYTLAVIPALFTYWIILRRIQRTAVVKA